MARTTMRPMVVMFRRIQSMGTIIAELGASR
jgi:hypothetical protein